MTGSQADRVCILLCISIPPFFEEDMCSFKYYYVRPPWHWYFYMCNLWETAVCFISTLIFEDRFRFMCRKHIANLPLGLEHYFNIVFAQSCSSCMVRWLSSWLFSACWDVMIFMKISNALDFKVCSWSVSLGESILI